MERDDLIVNDSYALNAHHSEEAGVAKRKKIWFVAGLLTLITFIEVVLGIGFKQNSDWWAFIKWSFIILTLFKAAYIVLSFMHLGDERKNLKWTILTPYLMFVAYLLFIAAREGTDMSALLLNYLGS
ncbi:MAG: cytochrome C oxidase subunit IV family protein [Flavobacteriales bacterium]|mgnify:CR=1 FL=1|jgi:cytochrome c oxidase subunit 4|tara:strand:- start:428 stop:808 length:381 start_codon:yes stop_codon:yes gene_type:complete